MNEGPVGDLESAAGCSHDHERDRSRRHPACVCSACYDMPAIPSSKRRSSQATHSPNPAGCSGWDVTPKVVSPSPILPRTRRGFLIDGWSTSRCDRSSHQGGFSAESRTRRRGQEPGKVSPTDRQRMSDTLQTHATKERAVDLFIRLQRDRTGMRWRRLGRDRRRRHDECRRTRRKRTRNHQDR